MHGFEGSDVVLDEGGDPGVAGLGGNAVEPDLDLANLWITGLEAEGRIEQTTINEYRRVMDNLVLPSVGGLKLREATTGRLDRLLLRLRDQSVNRQRKAKVVLGAMLDLAVRHVAIPVNPTCWTTRVHRPKQETKALRVEDLIEIRAAVRRWVSADPPGDGTWHQVVNIERRWRQIRKDTGYEWVTPHMFRKTVATLISEATTS